MRINKHDADVICFEAFLMVAEHDSLAFVFFYSAALQS